MTKLHHIGKWIDLYYEKFGRKPKVIPISVPEKVEILSDFSPCDYTNNGKNQIHGIDIEESPWASMTRARILEIGVERLSTEDKVDTYRVSIEQHRDSLTGILHRRLTTEILADVTHLDVSFDWDRLAWLKRRVKWIGSRWPVKRKTVRIEGKVLYPYLKIQAPADTHRVKFTVCP